ncbi:hypothetical protein TU82_24405 [Pseudomonas orientalis]|nr:hypothetical protein TU82_24405 [Pseudomonas orientalis]
MFLGFIVFEEVVGECIKEVLWRDGYGLRCSGHVKACGSSVQRVESPGGARHSVTRSDKVNLIQLRAARRCYGQKAFTAAILDTDNGKRGCLRCDSGGSGRCWPLWLSGNGLRLGLEGNSSGLFDS